jgi:hypothetical protein
MRGASRRVGTSQSKQIPAIILKFCVLCFEISSLNEKTPTRKRKTKKHKWQKPEPHIKRYIKITNKDPGYISISIDDFNWGKGAHCNTHPYAIPMT